MRHRYAPEFYSTSIGTLTTATIRVAHWGTLSLLELGLPTQTSVAGLPDLFIPP